MSLRVITRISLILGLILTHFSCSSRKVVKDYKKEKIEAVIEKKEHTDSIASEVKTDVSDIKIEDKNINFKIKPIDNKPVRFSVNIDGKEYKGEAEGEIELVEASTDTTIKNNIYLERFTQRNIDKEEKTEVKQQVVEKEKKTEVEYKHNQWLCFIVLAVLGLYKFGKYLYERHTLKRFL